MDIRSFFQIMVEREASDMFLRTNAVPRVRVHGVVKPISEEVVTMEEMLGIADKLLATEDRKRRYRENLDIDFVHYEQGIGRFRINIFTQRNTPALVARHVHTSVKNFKDLGLPEDLLKTFCENKSGLVILSGPAGSGKSTTIASMIEYINNNYEKHIVTIEDPIEFLFKDKKSMINQRELESDVHTYPKALKHVTQQSPDIIYIGNIRDVETMHAAITATELGALVLTTFHTVNSVQAVTRIVNFFPPYLHDEVRMQLSVILKGIVSLRLIPRLDKEGRVPAFETMVVTPTIARLIREGKVNEIQSFIDEGDLFGMTSFKKCLVTLVKGGVVDEDEARSVADSKDEFNLELRGVKRYIK
ncbi:MAG: PilT/PilU family type 4a pilus ATPase [Candidatus Omnitrophica bacterium]|nr:PilT/PilU family type 4a pilus ATPase [Candidatus Omnitrophota bacterium]